MAKTANPFLDLDVTKAFGEASARLPGVDMEAVMEGQRKNLEALTAANKVAIEGMQALARRQGEIFRQTMEEAARAMRELMAAGGPEEKAARQTELAKEAFQHAVTNMRELAELTAKANADAVEVVNRRVADGLDELKTMFAKRTGRG